MQQTDLSKEGELFFRQYLRSPRSVGSVIPSSRALGRGVAAETAWAPGQYVVELGGGTGSITMGLIERGIPRDRLSWSSSTARCTPTSRSGCPAST